MNNAAPVYEYIQDVEEDLRETNLLDWPVFFKGYYQAYDTFKAARDRVPNMTLAELEELSNLAMVKGVEPSHLDNRVPLLIEWHRQQQAEQERAKERRNYTQMMDRIDVRSSLFDMPTAPEPDPEEAEEEKADAAFLDPDPIMRKARSLIGIPYYGKLEDKVKIYDNAVRLTTKGTTPKVRRNAAERAIKTKAAIEVMMDVRYAASQAKTKDGKSKVPQGQKQTELWKAKRAAAAEEQADLEGLQELITLTEAERDAQRRLNRLKQMQTEFYEEMLKDFQQREAREQQVLQHQALQQLPLLDLTQYRTDRGLKRGSSRLNNF